jgi:glucan biosynthesis protein C
VTDGASTERYHGLDALRGFAMFLGILLHVGISFMTNPLPFWPVWDDQRTPLAELMLFSIHNFRMQLFFLLAGFFGCLLYIRYGWKQTALHRVKRIAIPFVLAVIIFVPALQAVTVYAASSAYRESDDALNSPRILTEITSVGETPWDATREFFVRGTFLEHFFPAHLWFLWYLLVFFAIMLPVALLSDRLRSQRVGRVWDSFWPMLFGSRWRWVVLPAITWLLISLMRSPARPDTPLSWYPDPILVCYYLFFFIVGWTLYRHRTQLTKFIASWRLALILGNVVILPTSAVSFLISLKPAEFEISNGQPFQIVSHGVASLYCWCMIIGLIGLFQHYFAKPKAWVRWGADSAYWCYIASLPPIVLLQFLVEHWPIPAIIKLVGLTIV